MDFREFGAWQKQARYERALRQIDAIRAQQFVYMEQRDREKVMDGLLETVKAHEKMLAPELTAEQEKARRRANIRRVRRILGGGRNGRKG